MGIVACVTIPMLVGIFFIGLIDLILFVKDKITVKQKSAIQLKSARTGAGLSGTQIKITIAADRSAKNTAVTNCLSAAKLH